MRFEIFKHESNLIMTYIKLKFRSNNLVNHIILLINEYEIFFGLIIIIEITVVSMYYEA